MWDIGRSSIYPLHIFGLAEVFFHHLGNLLGRDVGPSSTYNITTIKFVSRSHVLAFTRQGGTCQVHPTREKHQPRFGNGMGFKKHSHRSKLGDMSNKTPTTKQTGVDLELRPCLHRFLKTTASFLLAPKKGGPPRHSTRSNCSPSLWSI